MHRIMHRRAVMQIIMNADSTEEVAKPVNCLTTRKIWAGSRWWRGKLGYKPPSMTRQDNSLFP